MTWHNFVAKEVVKGHVVARRELSSVVLSINLLSRLPEPNICRVVTCCGTPNTIIFRTKKLRIIFGIVRTLYSTGIRLFIVLYNTVYDYLSYRILQVFDYFLTVHH